MNVRSMKRWMVACALASGACSDDGVQGTNLSGTGSSGGASADDGQDGLPGDDDGATAADDGGIGSSGGGDSTAGPSPMTDDGPVGSSSDDGVASSSSDDGMPSSSSDDGMTSSSSDDGMTSSSSDDGMTSSSSDDGMTTSCEPITDDPSAIGDDCFGAPLSCPEGYTCQALNGVQLQMLCQIICVEDCDCPQGYTCEMMEDKTMIPWFQCV